MITTQASLRNVQYCHQGAKWLTLHEEIPHIYNIKDNQSCTTTHKKAPYQTFCFSVFFCLFVLFIFYFRRNPSHQQTASSSANLIWPGKKPEPKDAVANQCHHETHTYGGRPAFSSTVCLVESWSDLFCARFCSARVIRIVRPGDLQYRRTCFG